MNPLPPAWPAAAAAESAPDGDAPLGPRLDLLHRGATMSALVGLAEASILSTLFWRHVEAWLLLSWLALFMAVRLGRVALAAAYFRDRGLGGDPQRWVAPLLVTAAAQSLAWGLGSFVLMAPGDLIAESALHVALLAVTLAGVHHLANFYPLVPLYTAGIIVPLVLRDLWVGGLFHGVLAVSCAMTALYMVSNGRRQAAMIAEAFAQRHRNQALIEALQRENAATRAAQREAEQAHEARARFFAAANHDLRQPLHAIGLLAQTLRQRSVQADVPQIAGQITECVDSLSHLVDELLELSRLDTGARPPVRSPVRLLTLVREVLAAHEPMARAKGLDLQVDLMGSPVPALPPTAQDPGEAPQADPVVFTDPGLLARVLTNLVGNAIRYTPAGQVTLRLRLVPPPDGQVAAPRGALEVAVEDTGIGIATDELPRIFDEFYQVGQPGRDERLGLGLGLATVRRIDALLGLDLQVKSTPGRGSTFSFTLPVAPLGAPMPKATSPVGPDLLTGRRVLLVEDDPSASEALAALLTAWGCDVRQAADGEEALAQVQAGFRPEAVVADLRLGGGEEGDEVIRRVQEATGQPDLPALLVTGDAGTPRVRQAAAGDVVVLRKPVKPARLRAWLQGVVSGGGVRA